MPQYTPIYVFPDEQEEDVCFVCGEMAVLDVDGLCVSCQDANPAYYWQEDDYRERMEEE